VFLISINTFSRQYISYLSRTALIQVSETIRLHGFAVFLSEDICDSAGHTSKSSTFKFWPIISADRHKSRETSHSQIDRYLWLNWRWDICTGPPSIRMSQLHTWPDISPLISIDGSCGLNSTIINGDDDLRRIIGLFGFSAMIQDYVWLHSFFRKFDIVKWISNQINSCRSERILSFSKFIYLKKKKNILLAYFSLQHTVDEIYFSVIKNWKTFEIFKLKLFF